MTDFNERIAELQYEAGMYQSLYENAVNVVAEKNDEIERLRAALKPFSGDKLPSLRKSEIDYDRNGLRRCISPMEMACRDASRALTQAKRD
jgi:hypothetical protein